MMHMKSERDRFAHCMCSINTSDYSFYLKKISWHPSLEKYRGFFIPSFLKPIAPAKAVLGVRSVGMGNHVENWGQEISEEQKTGNSVS